MLHFWTRNLIAVVIVGLMLDTRPAATAQSIPARTTMKALPAPRTPFDLINNMATQARSNDPAIVRELINTILDVTSPTTLPVDHWTRERLLKAELAYRAGSQAAITEADAVAAMNAFATAVGAPKWALTNVRQYHLVRASLKPLLPQLIGRVPRQGNSPAPRSAFEFTSLMSPAEAVLASCYLARAKAFEPSFQLSADQWILNARRDRGFGMQDPEGSFQLSVRPVPQFQAMVMLAADAGRLSRGSPGGALIEALFVRMGVR